jgi:hypothetical protein
MADVEPTPFETGCGCGIAAGLALLLCCCGLPLVGAVKVVKWIWAW